MTQRAKQMLLQVYQAPPGKIDLIPHGISDMPLADPNSYKDQFGVEGKVVLLTFGLLEPNKRIEQVLDALPQILAEFPDVVYVVMGATHPHELREHGETYRLSLENLASKNKVEKNVTFYNRFVELEELKEFIGAGDLYNLPPISSRPCKDPSAATCSTLRIGASALASANARERSARKPSTPASAQTGGRSVSQTRKAASSTDSEVLPAAASLALRSWAKSRVCGGSIIFVPLACKLGETPGLESLIIFSSNSGPPG
jgi:hypothetical protein